MPGPYEFVLLGLASWRIWHLLAEDVIFDRPRNALTSRFGDGFQDFVECPFCLGFWVALAWVGAFALWAEGAVWAALPFALNAIVVLVNWWLSKDE